MEHGDAREGKWSGNWRMEWVASTLHTTSEHGASSITNADANTAAASSRLNWRPRRFKWTRPFRRKTKCDFCACAITFQTQSTSAIPIVYRSLSHTWQVNFVNVRLLWGVCVSTVGWATALQAGRSRVRFPIVSMEFFIDIILPAAL